MSAPGLARSSGWAMDRLARLGRFIWSGWAGLAGVCLLAAFWQAGHEAYGDFILPAPLATLSAAITLLRDASARDLLLLTSGRALQGFIACTLVGGLSGIAAGYSPATLRVAQPIVTILLGVPPIAWIVLAMIWFGTGSTTVAVTILISALPIVFAGAVEGVVTRDRGLDSMAQVFGAGPVRRFTHVALRQIGVHLLPALILALGTAFKVAVMAELLANAGGVGGALARSRSMLDISSAMAWVTLAVIALLTVEYGLVRPAKAEFERWREAAAPWGVKR